MNYTYTFFGKRHVCSRGTFFVVFGLIVACSLFMLWSVFGGINKAFGLWGILAYVILFAEISINNVRHFILFAEISINNVRHSILPVGVNKFVGIPISIAAMIYYWFF